MSLSHAVAEAAVDRCAASRLSVLRSGGEGILRGVRARIHTLEAHHVLFYEGDDAGHVYELLEGSVMLYKLLADGRRQVVDVLTPTALFGMPAGRFQDTNAETLTPVTVRSVERREAEASADVQRDISRGLMRQVEQLHEHAVLLGRKSAMERVASFFMRLVPGRGGMECEGPGPGRDQRVVTLSMTRQEIADYLGLTIETVSRTISEFKRRGLIVAERQDQIRITHVCGICQLSGAH